MPFKIVLQDFIFNQRCTWFRISKLKYPIQKDIYFMYCIKQSVFNPWFWIWFSHFASNQKSEKNVPLGKKNILLLNIYNFENIFCNFLMIKKRQECNNSTVYRTRIENILVTQFEVFFWKIKLVGQIEEFNKKCHFAGHFSLFYAQFRNFHYFFYHTSFNIIHNLTF